MKYCANCGREIEDLVMFCPNCGTPADEAKAEQTAIYEEKICLDSFHRFFRYERTAWKAFAIVWLVLSLLFIILGAVIAGSGAMDFGPNSPADEIALGTVGITYIMMGVMYLPIAIINFVMVGKAKYYMDTLYNDVRPTVTRCNSVGMIVFGAMFNTIAMIFIIINFARAKGDRFILGRVVKRQQDFMSKE